MAISVELQNEYDTAKANLDAADLALKNASLLNLGAARKPLMLLTQSFS